MERPAAKTMKYYDYIDMASYIDFKYGIKQRDYMGLFSSGKHDSTLPYLDFWHWMLQNHVDERMYNGAYSTISFIHAREAAVKLKDDWARDIIDLYIKEYSDFWDDEDGWINVEFSW